MPTIFAANESQVLIDGEPIEGVRSIDYRYHRSRDNLYALGSHERIGVISGAQSVEVRITVASAVPSLDTRAGDEILQITAVLTHGETTVNVVFDDCYFEEKSFNMGVGGHGEAVYTFSAVRVREEGGAAE